MIDFSNFQYRGYSPSELDELIAAHKMAKGSMADMSNVVLVRNIISRAERALDSVTGATESDWPRILAHGLDDILKLCHARLKPPQPLVPRKVIIVLNSDVDKGAEPSSVIDAETGELLCLISSVSELHITNHLIQIEHMEVNYDAQKNP